MNTTLRVTGFIVLLTILSCGKKTSDPAGTTTTSGTTRAVIKNGTTTVAHVVDWLWTERVAVYIPSADRYAMINLQTGVYVGENNVQSDYYLLFSADACAGTPTAVTGPFVGDIGKTIIFDVTNGQYYLVTGRLASFAAKSTINNQSGNGSCRDDDYTYTSSAKPYPYSITSSSRPYNFEAIAPLTITYE